MVFTVYPPTTLALGHKNAPAFIEYVIHVYVPRANVGEMLVLWVGSWWAHPLPTFPLGALTCMSYILLLYVRRRGHGCVVIIACEGQLIVDHRQTKPVWHVCIHLWCHMRENESTLSET